MSSPNPRDAVRLLPIRLIALGLAVVIASTGVAQVRIPEQILKEEKITVVELSAEQALFELQRDYDELARTKGADHPETREKLGQLTEVKRRLAALGMNTPATPTRNTTTRQPAPSAVPSDAVDPEQLLAEQDPWQILLGLVQRVAILEAQVAELKTEIRQLRSAQTSTQTDQLPTLPASPRRKIGPAVPVPQ